MNDFFGTMKNVVKQRKDERYVANRQWIVDTLPVSEYKLLDHIKSVLIRVTPDKSVMYYLTLNKWKYKGEHVMGTPFDCMRWIERERKRSKT